MQREKQAITSKIKRDIIAFWLTHIYLRRLGKRYPDFFIKMINDITDNKIARKIMFLRYTGETPLKFEAISYDLNIDVRNVFTYHKKVIDTIISEY